MSWYMKWIHVAIRKESMEEISQGNYSGNVQRKEHFFENMGDLGSPQVAKEIHEEINQDEEPFYDCIPDEISPPSPEAKKPCIELIDGIFDHVQKLLCSKEFERHATELPYSVHNFMSQLQKHRNDLNRKDLCVIIAGETSGGKSTLVNRLVGREIFKPRTGETTAAICRIRNSNDPKNISCRVVGKNDQTIEERTFESGQGDKIMKYLQKYVDKNTQNASLDIDHVDISLHFPFLKGNIMIVDTPGIGGSMYLSDKMMKYLPNAVSFIFVSNVSNAGGVQNDRLVKIIQEVRRLHEEMDIPCFDPRDALFVSNKWDAVHQSERGDTWDTVQKALKEHWPVLVAENFFRTALRSAKDTEMEFDKEYERFKERLSQVVEKSQNARQIEHLNFLKNITKTIEIYVKGVLHVTSMSKDTCTKKMRRIKSAIFKFDLEMKETKTKLNSLISDALSDLSQTLLEELKSEEGKQKILNPPGKIEIVSVHAWNVTTKVKERISTYISEWKTGNIVLEKMTFVHNTIEQNFSDIQEKITNIENELKGSEKIKMHKKHDLFESGTPLLVGVLASAPLWIPIIAAAGTLCTVAGFILSPMVAFKIKHWSNEKKKLEVINIAYDDFVMQYNIANIQSDLESSWGTHYRKLVERLFAEKTEKQTSNLLGTIMRLQEKDAGFHHEKAELEHISHEIDKIKKALCTL